MVILRLSYLHDRMGLPGYQGLLFCHTQVYVCARGYPHYNMCPPWEATQRNVTDGGRGIVFLSLPCMTWCRNPVIRHRLLYSVLGEPGPMQGAKQVGRRLTVRRVRLCGERVLASCCVVLECVPSRAVPCVNPGFLPGLYWTQGCMNLRDYPANMRAYSEASRGSYLHADRQANRYSMIAVVFIHLITL